LDLNYRVVFVEDACRGIDLEDIEMQKKILVKGGAVVAKTERVMFVFFYLPEDPAFSTGGRPFFNCELN
jgi:hypothetical protein